MRLLFSLLQPWKPVFIRSVLFGALAGAGSLALSALSGWLIVRASQHPPVLYLLVAMVGVRFFGLLRAVSRYLERLASHSEAFAAANRLRLKLWDGLTSSLPRRRELQRGDQVLSTLIGKVDALRDLLPRVVLVPLSLLLTATGVLLTTVLILPQAWLLQLAVLLVALLIGPGLALLADQRSASIEQSQREAMLSRLTVVLAASAELRGNRVENAPLHQLEEDDRRATKTASRSVWAQGSGVALLTAAAGLGALGVLAVGAPAVSSGQLPAEALMALVLLQLGLVDVFSPLNQAAIGLPAALKALREFSAQSEVAEIVELPSAPSGVAIRADRLSFGWAGRTVVEELSLNVPQGSWLTVTGPSGSGKSTFLAVLMGYLEPSSGRCEVTGRIAWCPQEAHLFGSTVRGNLALARDREDSPTEEELLAALRRVGLGPLLEELPDGLETRIGAAGGQLSGGQRQRLAVARALLTRAEIVLLDEPTAHLDQAGAAELMADLHTALSGRTVVLVSHREQDRVAAELLLELDARSTALGGLKTTTIG
ncbi:thiol reductant ABC exporter subunit CydC [Psychromicrobium sp. YIM B11713]|uniref:thiol reductant ABC exporter subunit CydC n=1 Tax=Psychromicrobium sp. YIM B11713 TaxID=3145233 RepID=UPI00374ED45C